MSGGWFFVVAAEAITVGDTTIKLPGIGSYLATAIDAKDIKAVLAAVVMVLIVILLYDQLVFRPIVTWADKFKVELSASQSTSKSWLLNLLARTYLGPPSRPRRWSRRSTGSPACASTCRASEAAARTAPSVLATLRRRRLVRGDRSHRRLRRLARVLFVVERR